MSAPASWAKWLETKEKSAAGGARPAFLEQQFLWLGRRFLSLALREPGDPAAAATATTWAGRVCLGAGGERRNSLPLCLFPLSEPLLEGSSWGSGHISAHSSLGSLSSAQWTLKKKRDQEASAGLMVPQNLVHLPNPSIINDLSGSHVPASGPVSMIHNLIPWARHTECPSSILPRTRTPPNFYIWIFILYKCVLMSWEDIDSSFMMWLISCPHIAECAIHLSHRLCYGCVSFESLMNLQRKLWWDHFS